MKIQNKLKNLYNGGCLLFCYAYLLGKSEIDVIKDYDILVLKGIITKDCYINNADLLFKYWGINDKKIIKGKSKDGLNIARYSYTVFNHFVVCEVKGKNYKIIYNSLEDSNCVNKGNITEWRYIENE